MFKSLAIAASTLLVATSAVAAPSADSKRTDRAKAPQTKEKVYCIAYDKVVGSRVSQTECKTKKDWARDRVDVDKMLDS